MLMAPCGFSEAVGVEPYGVSSLLVTEVGVSFAAAAAARSAGRVSSDEPSRFTATKLCALLTVGACATGAAGVVSGCVSATGFVSADLVSATVSATGALVGAGAADL